MRIPFGNVSVKKPMMTIRRLQPPVHLLRAFCTVVRFGGVSRAAEALHLTQSAVSKQILDLENLIGVPLFERYRKRLALTPAGARYEKSVSVLLSRLEEATLELITSGNDAGSINISVLPTFGARWLIPRLPQLQQLHPQITLHFVPYVHGYDFSAPELDCSILFGDGHWPGAHAQYLCGNDVALIAPPPHDSIPPIRNVQDVARFALLRHVTVSAAWQEWSATHGVEGIDPFSGPQFDQFQTMIRAVSVGLGIALVPRCLVQDEIATGQVCEPLARGGYFSSYGYWLCYPEARAAQPPLLRFREWLQSQSEPVPATHPRAQCVASVPVHK